MRYFTIASLFVFIFLPTLSLYAFEREDMYARTLRILQLSHNQGDYSSYSKMMESFQDVRDKIKTDLQLGNINAAVDYELLVEGLVLENYQALQSVLGFNNYQDTTKEFADEINHNYAQKLAYSLKQNKIAFQTHFDVKKSAEQADCKLMLNGKALKQFSFLGPSGVPFYIGMYCADRTFEIKKIQAAESQKFYTITFTNLKPIIYRDDPVEMGVPNPGKQLKLLETKKIQISTGAGVDWYVSYNTDNYYRYAPATSPMLLYSTTQFVYKNFEFVFDLGFVVKTTAADDSTIEQEHTLFLRPIFLYTDRIYRYKNIFFLNANLGLSTFFVSTENFLKPVSYGIKIGIEPKVYISEPFFLGGDLGITYYFAGASANNMLIGTALRVGVDF